ncbi:hypothetical protein CDD81_8169 [Ophiocordyceps australis]|uniref:type I protein arginine methyltransferase n=1 Tax=Ophiocordyceps australis TaxID=1399860 RepID=A0A2C5XGB9_9HYPO|nr:hypothetical protein CDD81_8169 [Ophiocordyceps australis]
MAMDSSDTEPSCSSDSEQGEWLDVEPDHEATTFISLLDSRAFSTLDSMLADCKQRHGFDLVAEVERLRLDYIGGVKLVNFIRRRVKQAEPLPSVIARADLDSAELLQPVLENDAVLFSLEDAVDFEREEEEEEEEEREPEGQEAGDAQTRNRQLEAELKRLGAAFADYRVCVQKTLDAKWGDDQGAVTAKKHEASDSYYFESYAAHEIHETMLKDRVRTDAYRDFIYGNKHLFKDKVVLDIGCGTGILSMFCAKAGAASVIAVDKSDIIDKARENMFHNGLSSTITCLRGAIEDVQLPVAKVDVIVSEWMGYCLLYEAMLPSILFARDKYLKPHGLLVPSAATLLLAPVHDDDYVADTVTYWRDVYGFDMKAMQQGIYDDVRIHAMPSDSVCGSAAVFKTLHLHHVQPQDLVFTAKWQSSLNRPVDQIHGFLIWFDCFFSTSSDDAPPDASQTPEAWRAQKPGRVVMTTSPHATETHWKQGLLLVEPQPTLSQTPASSDIVGQLTVSVPESNARSLGLEASWSMAGCERRQVWKLS